MAEGTLVGSLSRLTINVKHFCLILLSMDSYLPAVIGMISFMNPNAPITNGRPGMLRSAGHIGLVDFEPVESTLPPIQQTTTRIPPGNQRVDYSMAAPGDMMASQVRMAPESVTLIVSQPESPPGLLPLRWQGDLLMNGAEASLQELYFMDRERCARPRCRTVLAWNVPGESLLLAIANSSETSFQLPS